MSHRWTADLDRRLTSLVKNVVAGDEQAWHRLLVEIGPRVEAWARQSQLLRRLGIDGEDDARSVLVAVLARLRGDGFANLHRYLASAGHHEEAEATETDALERLARGAMLCGELDIDSHAASDDDTTDTPLRGWLLALVRFAAKDHVKQRFGWRATARLVLDVEAPMEAGVARSVMAHMREVAGVRGVSVDEDGALIRIEYLPGTQSPASLASALAGRGVVAEPRRTPGKRDVNTNAERLGTTHQVQRPPITDWLTLTSFLEDVRDHMATFPSEMRSALELWLQDLEFDEIGARLSLTEGERSPAEHARALVRAAQARLRDRFRDQWPFAAREGAS